MPVSGYQTKTNRKKLQNAYSDRSPLVAVFQPGAGEEVVLASGSRRLILDPQMVSLKATRDTQGVQAMSLKKNAKVESAVPLTEGMFEDPKRYRPKSLPSAGAILKQEDVAKQLTLGDASQP